MQDYEKIGIRKPDFQPRATEYVDEMINLVKTLKDKGYAYVISDDGVYYDILKFEEYGKFSGQKMEKLRAGSRIDVKDKKRNAGDFVLWKFSKPNEPKWDSPWGKGRPGWHIECSAMSKKILGLPLDIHGGGQDLIFPHHENEIAQSEAAYGEKFVNYWMHNGMVNVNNVKMSKSLGNFITIRDLLKEYHGEVIRYFVLSGHYRKPIDFSDKTLETAKNSYNRLKNISGYLEDGGKGYNDAGIKMYGDRLILPLAVRCSSVATVNLVPVDIVSETIIKIGRHELSTGEIFNIIDNNPRLVQWVIATSLDILGIDGVQFVEKDAVVDHNNDILNKLQTEFDKATIDYRPYAFSVHELYSVKVRMLLSNDPFSQIEKIYLEHILVYAIEHNFEGLV